VSWGFHNKFSWETIYHPELGKIHSNFAMLSPEKCQKTPETGGFWHFQTKTDEI